MFWLAALPGWQTWTCWLWKHDTAGDRLVKSFWKMFLENVFEKTKLLPVKSFFLLGIFEDSYCSWWVGELVGSKLVSNSITWTCSCQVTKFHKTKHASFGLEKKNKIDVLFHLILLLPSLRFWIISVWRLSRFEPQLKIFHFMGGCDISGMFVSVRCWEFL